MRAAVLGSPIAHSLSPALHRAAYDALGLSDWSYDAVLMQPDGLETWLAGLGSQWAGLSLTMPLKQAVLPLLSSRSDLVEATGAANTVVLRDGGRHGENTDVAGIVRALREAGVEHVAWGIVVGAGATAASALAALQQLGESAPNVLVRDPRRATELQRCADRLGVRPQLDDLSAHSIEQRAGQLDAALLIAHSPTDNIVGIDNAARIYAAARHPKSFLALDGADHLLTHADDAIYAARMIACWSDRFLVDEHPATPKPASSAPVVVAETGQGTFLNHVVVGAHHFLTDEPVEVGGFDAGPSPYDLVAAGLGACTSMTLRLYANRKGIALRRVTVEVSHAKTHAEDCDACVEGTGPLIDHFERRIGIEGELDDQERAALARIADRCPVHRTLEGSARISTTLIATP